eukprot:g13075.t1
MGLAESWLRWSAKNSKIIGKESHANPAKETPEMRLEHTEPEQKDEEKQQSEKDSGTFATSEKETRQVVTGDAPAAKAAALNSVFVKANAKVAASDEED